MAARNGRPAGTKRSANAANPRGTAASTSSESAERRAELRQRSELLWDGQARPTRGPKPALTRDDVVRAAIAVADEGDLAALTMHAVAARLGFTTMALYRYFPNKEALIDAAVDAAMGEPPARIGPHEGWRQEVKHWAFAKRDMLLSRPWLAELPFVAAPHGPNWLSWHEAFLRTIAHTGLTPEDMMDVLSIVHGYVTGSSDTAISLARSRARGIPDEEWAQAVGADLSRAINDPRYPLLSTILSSSSSGITADSPLPLHRGKPRTMEEAFEFGIERVMDGIEAYMVSIGILSDGFPPEAAHPPS